MERYRAETPLEMAQRHVWEAEERIARVTKLAIETRALGYDTEQVDRHLGNFYDLLKLAYEHLKREEQMAATTPFAKPPLPPK